MEFNTRYTIDLPAWVSDYAESLPVELADDEAGMAVAVELSRRNIEAGTGGPFGAVVASSRTGRVISLGVNRVETNACSVAHAEIVALCLAQQAGGHWDLARHPRAPLVLFSSCEPCAMCLGAIPWSGVRRLVCGAARADAEAAGFDEGERSPDWTDALERRGVRVTTGVLREPAAAVLAAYATGGGTIYQPDRGA